MHTSILIYESGNIRSFFGALGKYFSKPNHQVYTLPSIPSYVYCSLQIFYVSQDINFAPLILSNCYFLNQRKLTITTCGLGNAHYSHISAIVTSFGHASEERMLLPLFFENFCGPLVITCFHIMNMQSQTSL